MPLPTSLFLPLPPFASLPSRKCLPACSHAPVDQHDTSAAAAAAARRRSTIFNHILPNYRLVMLINKAINAAGGAAVAEAES